jgi:hypothetical protein
MDHTGDTRHHFDENDLKALAEAERRFKALTGNASPGPRGNRMGTFPSRDRSVQMQKKPCFSLGWSAVDRQWLVG